MPPGAEGVASSWVAHQTPGAGNTCWELLGAPSGGQRRKRPGGPKESGRGTPFQGTCPQQKAGGGADVCVKANTMIARTPSQKLYNLKLSSAMFWQHTAKIPCAITLSPIRTAERLTWDPSYKSKLQLPLNLQTSHTGAVAPEEQQQVRVVLWIAE